MKSISAAILAIAAVISFVQATPQYGGDYWYGGHQHENLFVGFENPDNVNSCRTYDITYTCEHAPCVVRAYRKQSNEPIWRYIINQDIYDGTYSHLAQNHPGTYYTLTITDRLNNQFTSDEVRVGQGSLSCFGNGNGDGDGGNYNYGGFGQSNDGSN